jgi:hypothetical protein
MVAQRRPLPNSIDTEDINQISGYVPRPFGWRKQPQAELAEWMQSPRAGLSGA